MRTKSSRPALFNNNHIFLMAYMLWAICPALLYSAPLEFRDQPSGENLALEQAVNQCMAHNPELAAAQGTIAAQVGHLQEAGLWSNPVLQGDALWKDDKGELGWEGSSGWSVGLEQELATNGELGCRQKAALAELSAARAQLVAKTQALSRDTQLAYVRTAYAWEKFQLGQRRVEVAQDKVRVASATLQSGLSDRLPLDLALVLLHKDKGGAELARAVWLEASQTLARLMGQSPRVEGWQCEPMESLTIKEQLGAAPVQARPDLQTEIYRAQARLADQHAAQRAMVPNPSLRLANEDLPKERLFSVGVSVPLPVMNTGRARVQAAAGEWAQQTFAAESLRQQIISEQAATQAKLEAARKAVAIYQNDLLPAVAQAEENARRAFESGTTDRTLLLETQERLLDQRAEYLDTLRQLREAEVEWAYAQGTIWVGPGRE